MRSARWLATLLLLFPTPARADDHRADLYAGFSYADGSKLWGFHESYAFTLKESEPMAHDFSILGDLSVHFGSHDGTTATRVSYFVGPRLTIALRDNHHKLMPHVLIGSVHQNDGGADTNAFAVAIGGGWEYIPNPGSATESSSGLGFRVHADYVIRKGDDAGNFPRLSGGLIYRFRKN